MKAELFSSLNFHRAFAAPECRLRVAIKRLRPRRRADWRFSADGLDGKNFRCKIIA
jgi:hypothetical protein